MGFYLDLVILNHKVIITRRKWLTSAKKKQPPDWGQRQLLRPEEAIANSKNLQFIWTKPLNDYVKANYDSFVRFYLVNAYFKSTLK